MERSRRIQIKHHLSEKEIEELLREAKGEHRLRRIDFLKDLYQGDSIPEAAEREGRSAITGVRWAEAWNEGGLEARTPSRWIALEITENTAPSHGGVRRRVPLGFSR